ncbi:MAG: hypothetical protein AB7Q97_00050 [Gammaproteobacteria bacterium]
MRRTTDVTRPLLFSSKKDFSIPFTLHENEALYIGNFIAHSFRGKNAFGLSVLAGGYFVREDDFDRDVDLLRHAYPDLGRFEIKRSDLKAVAPPFIVAPKNE